MHKYGELRQFLPREFLSPRDLINKLTARRYVRITLPRRSLSHSTRCISRLSYSPAILSARTSRPSGVSTPVVPRQWKKHRLYLARQSFASSLICRLTGHRVCTLRDTQPLSRTSVHAYARERTHTHTRAHIRTYVRTTGTRKLRFRRSPMNNGDRRLAEKSCTRSPHGARSEIYGYARAQLRGCPRGKNEAQADDHKSRQKFFLHTSTYATVEKTYFLYTSNSPNRWEFRLASSFYSVPSLKLSFSFLSHFWVRARWVLLRSVIKYKTIVFDIM